jgi:hypothetical protein
VSGGFEVPVIGNRRRAAILVWPDLLSQRPPPQECEQAQADSMQGQMIYCFEE